MKKESVKECECQACAGLRTSTATEAALHAFVASHRPNIECDLWEFQVGLEFTNVVHWDVGYSGDARYYIYRDREGNLLAWYDRAKKTGFKPDCSRRALTNEYREAL